MNCLQPYRRQTFGEIVGIAAENTVIEPSQYNLFFEVSMVAGPSPPPNLPLEVMGTPLIRLNPTPFPWSSRAFAAQPAVACVSACALAFARKLH